MGIKVSFMTSTQHLRNKFKKIFLKFFSKKEKEITLINSFSEASITLNNKTDTTKKTNYLIFDTILKFPIKILLVHVCNI